VLQKVIDKKLVGAILKVTDENGRIRIRNSYESPDPDQSHGSATMKVTYLNEVNVEREKDLKKVRDGDTYVHTFLRLRGFL
jgi:hypothetical protein